MFPLLEETLAQLCRIDRSGVNPGYRYNETCLQHSLLGSRCMKITDVRSYVLKSPLGDQGFYASQESFSERSSCLVRIETDTGLVGWGEGGLWGAPEPVAAMIDHVLTPRIMGKNPLHMDVIWERLYAHVRDWGRQGTAVEAISGRRYRVLGHCGTGAAAANSCTLGRRLSRPRTGVCDRRLLQRRAGQVGRHGPPKSRSSASRRQRFSRSQDQGRAALGS